MFWKSSHAKSLQSCLTLCSPMDCSLPVLSMARILERVAMPSSRGPSQLRDQACISDVSCPGRRVLCHLSHLGSPQTVFGHYQIDQREWMLSQGGYAFLHNAQGIDLCDNWSELSGVSMKKITQSTSFLHLLLLLLLLLLSHSVDAFLFLGVRILLKSEIQAHSAGLHFLHEYESLRNKRRWIWLDITFTWSSHLSIALKCGHHLVHGSVEDVQEPVGSKYVPLYNFYLLFAFIEFKL